MIFHYHGYKDRTFLKHLSAILTLLGWIILLVSICGKQLFADQKIRFQDNKLNWFKNNIRKFIIYSLFSITVVATAILSEKYCTRRVVQILKTEPTNETIGRISKIESRNSRGGSKPWAIIEYDTQNGTVKQAMYNYKGIFSAGQTYQIRYSISHPEMFKIITQL